MFVNFDCGSEAKIDIPKDEELVTALYSLLIDANQHVASSVSKHLSACKPYHNILTHKNCDRESV